MTLTAEALDIMNLCTNFEFSTVFCYSVSLRATLNRYTCSKLKAFTLHKLLSFIQSVCLFHFLLPLASSNNSVP